MAREQILDIRDKMYDLFPNEDLDQIFADFRPPPIHDFDQPEGITIGQIKDWEKQFTAPGILQTSLVDPIKSAINYPFEKMVEYDKQSIPSDWQGPSGGAGYASNWRHAANTALLKNKIANAISPVLGDKISSMVGGTTAFGGGLLHELTSASPIWVDEESTVNDPYTLDVGPSKKLSTDFKEDMLANLMGAYKGKTGIADTKILESLLEDLSQDDAWSEAFENLRIEGNQNALWERFGGEFNKFRKRKKPPRLDKQSWIKKMKGRKGLDEIPTLKSDTSFITKKPTTSPYLYTPIHGSESKGGGGGYQPTTKAQNVARTASRVGPEGNVRAYGLASGGLIDIPLSGRSRYI